MLKLLLAAVLALLLLFAAGFGAYKGFQSWQGHRLVRRAEAYLASGDLRSAALSAHRAFQLNHENAGACRVLARIAEITGQPAALEWRKSAVLAAPDSIEDKIALANAALQFERPEVAKSTLAGLGPEAQRLPAFQEAEAQLAFSQKDLLGAEKY